MTQCQRGIYMSENKAAALANLFGSQEKLSVALGVDQAVVSRWAAMSGKRAGFGVIPSSYYFKILTAARDHMRENTLSDEWLLEVMRLLPERKCPTCGHVLEIGKVV